MDSGGLECMLQIYSTDMFPATHLLQTSLANQLQPVLALFGALAVRHPAPVLELTFNTTARYLDKLKALLPAGPLVSLMSDAPKWQQLLRAMSIADSHAAMLTYLLRELSNTSAAPLAITHAEIQRRLLWEISSKRYQEERTKTLAAPATTPPTAKWYEVFEHLATCMHDVNSSVLKAIANAVRRGDDKQLMAKTKNMAALLELLLTAPGTPYTYIPVTKLNFSFIFLLSFFFAVGGDTVEMLRYYTKVLVELRGLVFTEHRNQRVHVLVLWALETGNGIAALMTLFKSLCAIAAQLKQQVCLF